MNINDKVKVKLTGDGVETLHKARKFEVTVDSVGYYTFHLWELMAIFGPYIYQGMTEHLFENNEVVEVII